MSRSKKKAIYKDSWKGRTQWYWKTIRRTWKQRVSQFYKQERFGYWEFDDSLPSAKTIVDDWDYSDYTIDYEYMTGWYSTNENQKFWKEKLSRK